MKERIRVLLVEDDPVQRWVMSLWAGMTNDLELFCAGDGLEGLELALREEPDVLVLDLVLPGLSGMELLRRYRARGGRAGTLVISAAVSPRMSTAALGLGADFMLVKPVRWQETLREIRMLAGGLAQQCRALLLEMGAEPEWYGLRQAAQCAGLLGEKRCGSLKEAYVEVAAGERCGVGSVEKNIRWMVERLREKDSGPYRRVTGRRGGDPKPANGEFLRCLARAAALEE